MDDILSVVVFGFPAGFWLSIIGVVLVLFLPWAQWIDYKSDCRKHGKGAADEIRRRY